MHRTRALAAITVVALELLTAAPAAAKETHLRSVRACGLTGCVRLTDAHVLRAVERGLMPHGHVDARFGPYYRLSLRPSRNLPRLDFYLPLVRRIELNGESVAVGPATAARLRAELGSLQPIAPRVTAVTIGGRRAADPAGYVPILYGTPVHPPASVWTHRDVQLWFSLSQGTPWVDWGAAEYFPSMHVLHVPDARWVRVSASQASMIASDLHGHGRPAGGGIGWTPVAAVLVALGLAALLAMRLRPWGRERVA